MNPPAVFVSDEQDVHPVDIDKWLELANRTLIAQKVGEQFEVNVIFVDEKTIAELNEKFMGKEGPTDVLSFPIDESEPVVGRMPDNGGSGPGAAVGDEEPVTAMLGDIVICPSIANRKAPDHAGDYESEIALLLVHGILHILGMDHQEEGEALEMEVRERELLDEFYGPIRRDAWNMPGHEH